MWQAGGEAAAAGCFTDLEFMMLPPVRIPESRQALSYLWIFVHCGLGIVAWCRRFSSQGKQRTGSNCTSAQALHVNLALPILLFSGMCVKASQSCVQQTLAFYWALSQCQVLGEKTAKGRGRPAAVGSKRLRNT